ncbi:prepilin-type N-terminal cleavage/methylation domain-containing protein [Egicoccus sp. AB-alg6-2]|uniref:type IV pilus modification PilV family protein n=1 Tax=Egicoccus sp. AB-alg6-2 TaxID=3242692 RepID=UPI00359D36B4
MRTDGKPMRDEAGLTLVELIVAFSLLSIILAAAAGSLITFGRSAVDNERRVQATAVANRLHEELQALPWSDTALYDQELDGLADLPEIAATFDPDAETFEGRDLVLLEGPGACPAPPAPCSSRRDLVPYAVPPTLTIDGRDYEVFQLVTWDEDDGGIKRFTTFLRWEVMGNTITQRFDSMRAATPAEAGDPLRPRVIQFQVGPSPMELRGPDAGSLVDSPTQPLNVVVRFSRGVEAASVSYFSIPADHFFVPEEPEPVDESEEAPTEPPEEEPQQAPPPPLEQRTLHLTPSVTDPETGLFLAFEGTVPSEHRFPNGPRPFRVTGSLTVASGTETFGGTTTASFWGGTPFPQRLDPTDSGEALPPVVTPPPGGDEPATSYAVTVGTPIVNRHRVCLDANGRFYRTVEVTALVTGMTPGDYSVTVSYTANREQRTQAMVPPDPATISPAGTYFTLTLPMGDSHGFRKNDRTRFSVSAARTADGGSAGPVQSSQLEVRQPNRVELDSSCE